MALNLYKPFGNILRWSVSNSVIMFCCVDLKCLLYELCVGVCSLPGFNMLLTSNEYALEPIVWVCVCVCVCVPTEVLPNTSQISILHPAHTRSNIQQHTHTHTHTPTHPDKHTHPHPDPHTRTHTHPPTHTHKHKGDPREG